MTQDEIIRMALEAGFTPNGSTTVLPMADYASHGISYELERFFNLAFAAGAVHERAKELTGANISLYKLAEEAGFDVAQWAINGGKEVIVYYEGPITGELTRFAALVAVHEREACAKVCDSWPDYDVQGLEAAIRARGEK